MKTLIFLAILNLLFACAVNKEKIHGMYVGEGSDYRYQLNIDSTRFQLHLRVLNNTSSCNGFWETKGDRTILLNCSEPTDVLEKLSSSYMKEKQFDVQVISPNELRIRNVSMFKQSN